MIQNGLYFLIHVFVTCYTPEQCVLQQSILDVQKNKELCIALRDNMKRELPDEVFSCVQIQAI